MRFLLIDRILAYTKEKSAVGSKDVTMSEDFLADHFPRFPVMPGVLQIEAITQLASWLVFTSSNYTKKGILAEIGTIKFRDFVKPGDKMVIDVTFESADSEGVVFKATVKVDDKLKTTLSSARLRYVPVDELEDPEEAREYFDFLTGEKPFGVYVR